jgi:TP901 family phage tail tape measure protein
MSFIFLFNTNMPLITLKIEANTYDAEKQIEKIQGKIQELSQRKVKVWFDASFQNLESSIKKATGAKKVPIEAELDTAKFINDMKAKVPKLALDTKVPLDVDLIWNRQTNIAWIKEEMRLVKKQLKEQEKYWIVDLQLSASTVWLQNDLTEAKAKLKNYINKGTEDLSRFRQPFEKLWETIKWLWLEWFWNSVAGIWTKLDTVAWWVRNFFWLLAGFWVASGISLFLNNASLEARKFENSLARINTVAKLSKSELAGLWDEVKRISGAYGIAKDLILDAGFNIASAWVWAKDLPEILELSARAAVASWESITDNFNGIISVVKAYWLEMGNAVDVANLFFKANEVWQTTVWQIAQSIWWVTPVANAAWLSLNELFAVYGTLTGVTGTASEVTTQLTRALQSIIAPTTESRNIMNDLWINFDQNSIRTLWLAWAMKELYDKTWWNLEVLRKVTWSSEALALVLALWWTQATAFASNIDKMKDSTTALDDAVNEMTKTTEFQVQVAQQRRDNFQVWVWEAINSVLMFIFKLTDTVAIIPAVAWNALVQAVTYFFDFVGNVSRALWQLWPYFSAIFWNLGKIAKAAWNNIAVYMLQGLASLWNKVWLMFNPVIEWIEWLINKAIWWINKLISWLGSIPWLEWLSSIGNVSLGRISTWWITSAIWKLEEYNVKATESIKLQLQWFKAQSSNNSLISFWNKLLENWNKTREKSIALLNKEKDRVKENQQLSSQQIKDRLKSWLLWPSTPTSSWENPLDKTPWWSWSKWWGGWWWSSNESEKKAIQELEKKHNAEMKKINDDATLSTTEKYLKMKQLDKDYQQSKNDIQNKWSKNYLQDAEEAQRKINDDRERIKRATQMLSEMTNKSKQNLETIGKWLTDIIGRQKDWVQKISDSIVANLNKINEIKDKIAQVNTDTQNSLSSRFLQVSDEIKAINEKWIKWEQTFEDVTKLQKLQEELTLLKANTTEAERAEALRVASLSNTQRILESRDKELAQLSAKKLALESETTTLVTQLRQQDKEYQASIAYRDNLEKALATSSIARYNQMSASLSNYLAKLSEFRSELVQAKDEKAGTVVTNDNKKIEVTNIINNQSDAKEVVRQLERAVGARENRF